MRMANKLSHGEKLRIRFAQELLANRDSSLVSAAVYGYDAALEDLRSEEARERVRDAVLSNSGGSLGTVATAVISALLGEH